MSRRGGFRAGVEIKKDKKDFIAICIAHHPEYVYKRFAHALRLMQTPDNVRITFPMPGFTIDLAVTRNTYIERAIKMGCTHIFFLDADNPPEPDTLIRLYKHDKECITGIYHLKMKNMDDAPMPVLYTRRLPRFDYSRGCLEFVDSYKVPELFTVEACGFGCLLIKTALLKRIKEKYKDDMNIWCHIPNSWVTEDIPFCDRVLEVGGEIWAHSKVLLNHIGHYEYKGDLSQMPQFGKKSAASADVEQDTKKILDPVAA